MYVSKLLCAFAFDSAKFKLLIFFLLAYIFFSFLWTCLSKYRWKDMADTIKHFEQQTSVFCILSCILFIQKSSSLFHTEQSCDRLKFETSAAQEKKKKKKTMLKRTAFRSGFPICLKLWDNFFFFSLTRG